MAPNAFHALHIAKLVFFLVVCLLVLISIFSWKSTVHWPHFVKRTKSRTIIIDSDCIRHIITSTNHRSGNITSNNNNNPPCTFPLRVALVAGDGSTLPMLYSNNTLLRVDWTVVEQSDRDYWLFKDARNATNSMVAMKRFRTEQTVMAHGRSQFMVEYPSDLGTFEQRWRQGRFLECQIVLKRNATDLQRFMPLTMIDRGAELTAHMEQFNITGFLFGGTLLGWYRECSLIPHTGDLDFGMLAVEHSPAFLDSLIRSEQFLLKWILGHPRDGLEITIWMDNFKTDIFYVYHNKTRDQSFTTGMRVEKQQRLRWFYPRIDALCTGAMGGRLFHVPCNVEQIEIAEYGPNGWQVDFPTSQFFYDKSHKNKESGEVLSDADWKRQYNMYYPKAEHNQTLPEWD